jgi:hypothetical protein
MVRIPTPIPESIVDTTKRVLSGPLLEVLWRVLVITVGLTVLYVLAVASSGFLIGFIAVTAISIVFSDDIRQALIDVYRRNFWIWRA